MSACATLGTTADDMIKNADATAKRRMCTVFLPKMIPAARM
ncbi:hypothetical protein [Actinocrinis sp.]|nr:hypothetical protein [Actinocrinis sp.]HZP50332.1 hypothetical protein [Actinocrinis sp.]